MPYAAPSANLTAVCVVGEQRTFLEPVVQLGFARRLHRPGYEYFVVTDQRRPRPELLKIAPVRAWIAGGLVGHITGHGDHSGCAANTCNSHRFLYPAMERLSHCYPAIQNEEGRRGMRYEFLLRVRPDHLFLRRQPPVDRAFSRAFSRGKMLLWDDQIVAARRVDAPTALLTPRLVYRACVDEWQWWQACRQSLSADEFRRSFARCLATGELPCPTMHLITVFGRGRYDLHPWNARSWNRPDPDHEDFCLKRREYVNESKHPTNCKVEPGCMDC